MKCYRRALQISLQQKVTNIVIRNQAGSKSADGDTAEIEPVWAYLQDKSIGTVWFNVSLNIFQVISEMVG